MNSLRTVFLLTLLTGLLVFVGRYIGGQNGMIVALVIGLGLNFVNYWFSSKIVLAVYGARVLEPGETLAEAPWLVDDIADLARRADIPMPKVAVIPRPAPNAFATGRNPSNAVVAVTEGILRTCDRRQVRAVIGHELGHVKNRDMLTMTLVAGAVSAISMLVQFGFLFRGRDRRGENMFVMILLMIAAPLMAMMIQMAISRSREFAADDAGAELSNDPGALADALERLHSAIPQMPPLSSTGATAHMMIANPFHGMGRLFSTHPDPAVRIARLREMAARRR
jgi:heat shock protein HtpX